MVHQKNERGVQFVPGMPVSLTSAAHGGQCIPIGVVVECRVFGPEVGTVVAVFVTYEVGTYEFGDIEDFKPDALTLDVAAAMELRSALCDAVGVG